MALKRFEVLTIDATVIAGIMVLLTLSGLTFENGFFNNFSVDSDEVNWFEYLKFYFLIFIISSILPFALSAITEIKKEMFLRRLEIREKLSKELKKSKENNEISKERIIQKNWIGL